MKPIRVLIADDEEPVRGQIAQVLNKLTFEGQTIQVEPIHEADLDKVPDRAQSIRLDLIILDVRKDGPDTNAYAGTSAFGGYRSENFVPTVFYTAVPHLVGNGLHGFVTVVDKKTGIRALKKELQRVIDSRLLQLLQHLDYRQRELMSKWVPELSGNEPLAKVEAAARIARTLALELEGEVVRGLLGLPADQRHPSECYIYPVTLAHPTTGDVYLCQESEAVSYWVVLNPACDLVSGPGRPRKVDGIVMAKGEPLIEVPDVKLWLDKYYEVNADPKASKGQRERLTKAADRVDQVIGNRDVAHHFLPAFGNMPAQRIDFRQLRYVDYDDLGKSPWERVATLTSPYAESINSRFTQFLGRVGVPDVDKAHVRKQLLAE